MYPSWQQKHAAPAQINHILDGTERRDSSQDYTHPPSSVKSPGPKEPNFRPPLQTRLTETAERLRIQDTFQGQDSPHSTIAARGHNLPALKDILNTDSYSRSPSSHGSPWDSNCTASQFQQHLTSWHNGRERSFPTAPYPPSLGDTGAGSQHIGPYASFGTGDAKPSQGSSQSPLPAYSEGRSGYVDVPLDVRAPSHPGTSPSAGSVSIRNLPVPHDGPSLRALSIPSHRSARSSQGQPTTDNHGKYLGVQDIAGDGSFHCWEDGYRCPTHVDGEQVNPAWGLTKANKPRKRLATACLDCREKKIKCEPGRNSCIQCEKAMRICRKAPEKIGQAEPPVNRVSNSSGPRDKTNPALDVLPKPNGELDALQKRRSRADPSPPLEPSKKYREASPPRHVSPPVPPQTGPLGPTGPEVSMGSHMPFEGPLDWKDDPYAIEPERTVRLLQLYFTHINDASYCFFPRAHFLRWVKEYPRKCQNERLILYAMLAAASIVAGSELAGFGKQCAQVATDALATQIGRFSVASAQSKLLLAYYCLAKGAEDKEWDYVGSAIRTVAHMELNTEEGCMDDSVSKAQSRYEFGFSPAQLAECKRRTFWACFLQDRFCGGCVSQFKPEDVYVRLPCADQMYEQGVPSEAPFYNNHIIDAAKTGPPDSIRAAAVSWLIPVAAVWSDVIEFTFRAARRGDSSCREAYDAFYIRTQHRLKDWLDSLPSFLHLTPETLERSAREGYASSLVLMHILFDYTMIRLNRYMRHRVQPKLVITRNIWDANCHGHRLLRLVDALRQKHEHDGKYAGAGATSPIFLTPFIGEAIIAAVDVVSAGGHDSKLKSTLDEIHSAVAFLAAQEERSKLAKFQMKVCEKRFKQLENIRDTPERAKSGCWLERKWGVNQAIEMDIPLEDDCIYGLSQQEGDEGSKLYFDAFDGS